jgi:hypothetical protein
MTTRTASPETIDKAKKFMTCMTNLLNFVEDMVQFIPEGRYLEMMNLTKEFYGFKPNESITTTQWVHQVVETVSNNPVVLEQQRITRYTPKKYNEAMNDMEKLKSGRYAVCEKCDKIIAHSYMKQHITNGSCVRVDETKRLTKTTTHLTTTQYKKCITLIRAWLHKADLRKIHMYRVALEHYKHDADTCDDIKQRLDKIAITLN